MPSFGIWDCVIGLIMLVILAVCVVGVLGVGAAVVGFIQGITESTLKPPAKPKDVQKPYEVTPEAVAKRRRK